MQLRYKKTERFDTLAPVTNGVRLRKRGEGGFFGCRHKGFGIKKCKSFLLCRYFCSTCWIKFNKRVTCVWVHSLHKIDELIRLLLCHISYYVVIILNFITRFQNLLATNVYFVNIYFKTVVLNAENKFFSQTLKWPLEFSMKCVDKENETVDIRPIILGSSVSAFKI